MPHCFFQVSFELKVAANASASQYCKSFSTVFRLAPCSRSSFSACLRSCRAFARSSYSESALVVPALALAFALLPVPDVDEEDADEEEEEDDDDILLVFLFSFCLLYFKPIFTLSSFDC